MIRPLIINCPPMGVSATGHWWEIWADRVTDNLVCRGSIEGVAHLTITFPPCLVKKEWGRWMVESVLAYGLLDTGERLQIRYPAEPVLRDGLDMVAQPVSSVDAESYVQLPGGRQAQIRSRLPLARSTPVGLGLTRFIVEAVTLPGTVEWPE